MTWIELYKIVFMSELLIAEIMLVFPYPKRKGFACLFPLSLVFCYAIAVIYPQQFVNNWFSSSLMFLTFFCVTIIAIKVCFKTNFDNVLFCAVSAYTVQHISYLAFSFIDIVLLDGRAFISSAYSNKGIVSLSGVGGMMAFSFVIYVAIYFFIYISAEAILKKYVGKNGDLKFKSLTVIAFITFALVVDIVLSDVFRYTDSVSKSIKILYYALNMLLCLALLCLQMSMIKRKDIEQEMAMMSTLYEEQQKHYKIRKETIDLINIKCHDFRHQIREIGTNRSVDKKTIQEMQDLISFYDSEIHTGNKTIDTILTEKSLICHKKKIDFTCIADGKLLSFLEDEDIYALFGNILDNAVEAVDEIQDPSKRCINLVVEREKGAIVIRQDNYYVGKIVKNEEGLINTSKSGNGFHGFGMKSIREIVTRYEGVLNIDVTGDTFRLSIVFFK